MKRLAATLTDAAWLTILCVTAVPTVVRAARGKAADVALEPLTCATCVVEQWEHEGAGR